MRHTAVSVGGTKPPVSHPITPDHAEANFKAALAKLSAAAEAGTAVIPHVELAALARALPAVILGERLPVWRLLAWVRALNPTAPTEARSMGERGSFTDVRAGSPTAEMSSAASSRQDELQVMTWLHKAQLVRHSAAVAVDRELMDSTVSRQGRAPTRTSRRVDFEVDGSGRHGSAPSSPLRDNQFFASPAPRAHRSLTPPSTRGGAARELFTPWRERSGSGGSGRSLRLSTLDAIIPAIASGELLCDIAASVSEQPLPGVFRPPRTCATALSNIKRATMRLREAANAASGVPSQEEIGDANALLRGDRTATLKWLLAAKRIARARGHAAARTTGFTSKRRDAEGPSAMPSALLQQYQQQLVSSDGFAGIAREAVGGLGPECWSATASCQTAPAYQSGAFLAAPSAAQSIPTTTGRSASPAAAESLAAQMAAANAREASLIAEEYAAAEAEAAWVAMAKGEKEAAWEAVAKVRAAEEVAAVEVEKELVAARIAAERQAAAEAEEEAAQEAVAAMMAKAVFEQPATPPTSASKTTTKQATFVSATPTAAAQAGNSSGTTCEARELYYETISNAANASTVLLPPSPPYATLTNWLRSLGPGCALDENACALVTSAVDGLLVGWRDGTSLALLIEFLEGRAISGVERKPTKAAHAKRTVDKVLEVLKARKGMPLAHLYHSHRLARGEAAAVLPLLIDVRASYGAVWAKSRGGAASTAIVERQSRSPPRPPPPAAYGANTSSWCSM